MLVDAIETTNYLSLYRERSISPKTVFYRRLIQDGVLEDFLVVVPQPATDQVEVGAVGKRSVVSRDRREGRGGKFGEITDRKHRDVVVRFVQEDAVTAVEGFHSPKRGAVLLYLAQESTPTYESAVLPVPSLAEPERGLVAAFSSYVPNTALTKRPLVLRFRVRDPEQVDVLTIDAVES